MQNEKRVGRWFIQTQWRWRCNCAENNENDYHTIWCGFCSTERPKTPPNKSMHLTAYRIRMKRGFATILKNEKEIEPLSGLLVVGGELKQLQELVNLANQAAAQQSFAPDSLKAVVNSLPKSPKTGKPLLAKSG